MIFESPASKFQLDLNNIIYGKEDYIKSFLKILFIKEYKVEVTELYRKLDFGSFIDTMYILSKNRLLGISEEDLEDLLILCACVSLKLKGNNWHIVKEKLNEYHFSPVRVGLKISSIRRYAKSLEDTVGYTIFTDNDFKEEVLEAIKIVCEK